METDFLLRGLLLGFSIAAPVGPIGILCIRRTLLQGWWHGFLSGLGAATADSFYGALAGFGLTLVTDFLVGHQATLQVIGGLFLCYLGVRTFLARPAQSGADTAPARSAGLAGSYASTLLLTLSNPMTILSFVAVFAGFGLADTGGSRPAAFSLVLGVFIGSALWWVLLSTAANALSRALSTGALRWVNRLSGVIIVAFGVLSLGSLLLG